MTVSTQTSSVTSLGNGSTTVWNFSFIGVSATDLIVTYTDANGNETILNPNVYTVSLNAPATGQLWGIGGTVTYPLAGSPIASGTFLTITRTVPFEQTISINNQGAFYPQVVEQAMDLIELQLQQTQTEVSYALQCPLVDSTAPTVLPPAAERASLLLGFDNTGEPLLYTPGAGAPLATSSTVGSVKPDNKTTFVNNSAVISASGGFNLNFTPVSTTTHSFAAAGNLITPQYNLQLYSVAALLTTVTGGVYKIGVALYNTGTNEITTLPTYTSSFTETSGVANKWIFGLFNSIPSAAYIALNAGMTYLIFVVRTDSTTTVSTTLDITNTTAISPGIYQVDTSNSVHLASVSPGLTDTWTTETGFYVIDLLYQFA